MTRWSTFFTAGTLASRLRGGRNRAVDPQVENGVEIGIERIHRRHVEHLVNEHVRMQVGDEEQRRSARVTAADHAGLHGPREVIDHDAQPAARRALLRVRVERHHHRGLPRIAMHLHRDRCTDHPLHERHELLGEPAQHDPGVLRRIDCGQLLDVHRHAHTDRAHGGSEQGLLRREVPEHGRRRDADQGRNIRQRGAVEAFLREDAAGRVEKLFRGNAWWPSHDRK